MKRTKAKRHPKVASQRRTRSMKPETIEVGGHQLTKDQYREYLDQRIQINRQFGARLDWSDQDCERRALSDCLYRWRPSVQAHEKFKTLNLWQRVVEIATPLAALKQFPLSSGDQAIVRIGNSLLLRVADVLRDVEQELRTTHAGISAEVESAVQS